MIESRHLSIFVDQYQSRIGKAALYSRVVDVLASQRVGLIVLNLFVLAGKADRSEHLEHARTPGRGGFQYW